MKRQFARAVLATIVGAGFLLWGLYTLATSGDVRCGGDKMTAGDSSQECVHYGEGKRLNYAEQKGDNVKQSLITGGVGLALLGVGGYGFVQVSRERREQSPTGSA